jgi:N-acetylmuramoyl-L-alanine amidase
MVTRRSRFAFYALIFCCVDVAQAATVQKLRVWRAEDYSRIVLDLSEPVGYNLVLASNPNRIILTLSRTDLTASIDKLPLTTTPIEIVRSSVIDDVDLRLVFDLKRKISPKSFLLKKSEGNSDRLVIDLYDAAETANAPASNHLTATKPKAASPASEPTNIESVMNDETKNSKAANNSAAPTNNASTNNASTNNVPTTNASAVNGRQILIAVDAGHGGADSGALGPTGMREKNVTLAIAKELTRVIDAQPGYSARLTRSGDYFVELQKRRDLARDMKADLFISVHADSFTDSSAYGASVFALSRKGATSEMARFLAQRENESDLIGRVGGVSLEDKDPQLAGVLVDLSMTSTVNSSLQVGSNVLTAISAISPLHARHVEQAGFVVLKSPDVPSILVETGFISNVSESRKLASTDYREQMAQSIFKGVRQYFAQHPPANTHASSANAVAENTSVEKSSKKKIVTQSDVTLVRKHVVISGDTLTDIALQYKVSTTKIRKANNMKTDIVKLGQTLKIPAQ